MQTKWQVRNTERRAFSLLELMIVILIISFTYMLLFASMQRAENKPKALTAENLKSTLIKQGVHHKEAELFCLNQCQSCYLYQNGETTPYKGELALGDLEVYEMDKDDKLAKIDFGRYEDHDVCLRFVLHHNSSSSQMVIKTKNGIYYLPTLFGEVAKMASLEEAEERWLAYTEALKDNGEFY